LINLTGGIIEKRLPPYQGMAGLKGLLMAESSSCHDLKSRRIEPIVDGYEAFLSTRTVKCGVFRCRVRGNLLY